MHRLLACALVVVANAAAAGTHDFYGLARYPEGGGLKSGVELYEVEESGGAADEYARRVVRWWPRKGVDIIDPMEGMPLREWTWREKQPGRPAGFEAHLIGFRGMGNTMSSKFRGDGGPIEPAVVLRLADGRKRCFLRGSFCDADKKFIMALYVKEMARIKAGLDQTPRVKRPSADVKFPNNARPGEPGTIQVESERFIWLPGSQAGSDGDPWMNEKEPDKAAWYRKGSIECAESWWAMNEYAGHLMPYWDRKEQLKYEITVPGTKRDGHQVIPGYAGGGYGGCGIKGAGGGPWSMGLFHEWGHGAMGNRWRVGGGEAQADMHQAFATPVLKGNHHVTTPWRNIFNGSMGYGYTAIYCDSASGRGLVGAVYSGRYACRHPWSVQLTGARPGTPRECRADLNDVALRYSLNDAVPAPHDTAAGTAYLAKLKAFAEQVGSPDHGAAEAERMTKGRRHPNGGGWVASTATVAATAYVGPEAMVLGQAKGLDQAIVGDYAVVTDRAVVYHSVSDDLSKVPPPTRDAPTRPTKEFVAAVEKAYGNIALVNEKVKAGVGERDRAYERLRLQKDARSRERLERSPAFLKAEADLQAANDAVEARRRQLATDFAKSPEAAQMQTKLDAMNEELKGLSAAVRTLEAERFGADEGLKSLTASRKEADAQRRAREKELGSAFEKTPETIAKRAALAELSKQIKELQPSVSKLERAARDEDAALAALYAKRKASPRDHALNRRISDREKTLRAAVRSTSDVARRYDAMVARRSTLDGSLRTTRTVFRTKDEAYTRFADERKRCDSAIRERQKALRHALSKDSADVRRQQTLTAEVRELGRELFGRREQFIARSINGLPLMRKWLVRVRGK